MTDEKYVVFNPEGGLGKIIASTAVVRNIQATYPDRKIIVVTPWPEVFLNNERVDRVYRTGNHPYFFRDFIYKKDTIVLKGEPYFCTEHMYHKQHLVKTWCEYHKLKFDGNIMPELYFTANEVEKVKDSINTDKPILLLQTNGGMYQGNPKPYCWTRDIPHEQAQVLVKEFIKDYYVVHITRPECKPLEGTQALGEIDKRTLMLLPTIAHNCLFIDSCLQHAAAAVGKKSTVLWVGTKPNVFGYDIHNNIGPSEELITEKNTAFIDSLFFDYDFMGNEHEYPFHSNSLFKLQDVYNSIIGPADGSTPLGAPAEYQAVIDQARKDHGLDENGNEVKEPESQLPEPLTVQTNEPLIF